MNTTTKTNFPTPSELRSAAAVLGRKGGSVRTEKPKGLAALSKRKRTEIARIGTKAAALARKAKQEAEQ
jgi:hypothetical protein